MYFPFLYSFQLSFPGSDTVERYVYVVFQPGPGRRWCTGWGQLSLVLPLPCPKQDGAWVPQAPGTPARLCLDSWVLCSGEELELSPWWGAPRLVRPSVDKGLRFWSSGDQEKDLWARVVPRHHLQLFKGSQEEWSSSVVEMVLSWDVKNSFCFCQTLAEAAGQSLLETSLPV